METHPSIQIIAQAAKRAHRRQGPNELDALCTLWAHFMAGRVVCDWKGRYFMLHRVEVNGSELSIIGVNLNAKGIPSGAEVKVPVNFIVLQENGL